VDLGLGIRHPSYNVYVAGLSGTGKNDPISRELMRRARTDSRPSDWVYVNNFDRPDHPAAISLKAPQWRCCGRRSKPG
jgi:Cdc6-like AAA superfamily ATPase